MTKQRARRQLQIDFLYLDLEVCTRCRGTDASLEAALSTVDGVLEAAGVDVRVTKTLVDSEQKALSLGLVTSPTIRVDGKDIALEFRESRCESEACACGSGDGADKIQCRVWVYEGQEYTEAPAPMIVNAILSSVYGPASVPATVASSRELPENLRHFFRAEKEGAVSQCCDQRERESCCDPAEKEACCGPSVETASSRCGCR
jgi:hypothetical protein